MRRHKIVRPKKPHIFRGWNAWCVRFSGNTEIDRKALAYVYTLGGDVKAADGGAAWLRGE
jgi:hypothetical protein